MNIAEILRSSQVPPLDAEILLSLAIKKPKEYLFSHPEKKLSPADIIKFKKLVSRRLKNEPITYLTGKKEFYGLDFNVNKNVLIPRPETEFLVEASLQGIMNYELGIRNIVDVGTGSGNIVISVVKKLPANIREKINFYATDISEKALYIAKKNAKRHGVSKHIKFIKSDLLEFIPKKKIKGNIIIVANLPYVSHKLYRKNSKNLKYEPKTALVSGTNGLDHYMRLVQQIRQLFTRCYVFHVVCYVEISPEQKRALARIAKTEMPFAKIMFFKDLAEKTRMAKIIIED